MLSSGSVTSALAEALTLLNRAVTLDCDWAKQILIKSDKERS
jgi:hypothetical protein